MRDKLYKDNILCLPDISEIARKIFLPRLPDLALKIAEVKFFSYEQISCWDNFLSFICTQSFHPPLHPARMGLSSIGEFSPTSINISWIFYLRLIRSSNELFAVSIIRDFTQWRWEVLTTAFASKLRQVQAQWCRHSGVTAVVLPSTTPFGLLWRRAVNGSMKKWVYRWKYAFIFRFSYCSIKSNCSFYKPCQHIGICTRICRYFKKNTESFDPIDNHTVIASNLIRNLQHFGKKMDISLVESEFWRAFIVSKKIKVTLVIIPMR